jgi:large subunit ribosomal protein L21
MESKPKTKTTKPKAVKSTEPKAVSKPKSAPKAASNSFAVFATGGKQYAVKEGDMVKIEKIIGEYKEGDKINFDKVLLVDSGSDTSIGTPFIKGASIDATLKKISRYKTIDVIKYKQKSRYFKKNGHRQPYFEVQIDSIK